MFEIISSRKRLSTAFASPSGFTKSLSLILYGPDIAATKGDQ
ncbi:MAG: hypothetical protein ACJ72R_19285 [Nitrososphaeraceae archaeon]